MRRRWQLRLVAGHASGFSAQRRAGLTAVASGVLLAACGDGINVYATDGSAPAPAPAPAGSASTVRGAITGFRSVMVDGKEIADTAANVELQGDADLAGKGRSTDLAFGQHVEIDRDADGTAQAIHLRPDVVGVVAAIDAAAATLTVATVSVRTITDPAIAPPTFYSGYARFADIAVGDRVEVHGHRDPASGALAIVATRIEKRASGTPVLVTGPVAGLSTASRSFTLGALSVSYPGNVTLLPAGAALVNGSTVTVVANAGLSGNALAASAIRVRKAPSVATATQLSGLVAGFTAGSATITVGDATVDLSKATIAPQSASLANGRYAVVTGTFDPASGKLAASTVTFPGSSAEPIATLRGTITDFASASSLRVRGTLVDASKATFANGELADLADDVAVELTGDVAGDRIAAATIRVLTVADLAVVDLVGTVGSYDTGTRRLTIALPDRSTQVVTIADSTVFVPDGRSAGDLKAGAALRVRARPAGGVLTAEIVDLSA